MALKDQIPELVAYVDSCKIRLVKSKELLEIYENDLLKYIEAMFRQEMGEQTYEAIRPRIPPINVLRRIVDKLSQIYQQGVIRTVVDGNDADQELLDWYIGQFDANTIFNQGNEFLNLDRINLMQPYYDDENSKPDLRAVPNDRYLVYSTNKMNPLSVTHVLLNRGKSESLKIDARRTVNKVSVDVWIVWSKEEIIIFDSEGSARPDLMAKADMDGSNPFGVLPFEYVNSSKNFLVPPTDSDTKRMTVLIPALLGDLNYAAKFQSFSQIFAFNTNQETWTIAPNSVHFIDDKPGGESKASVEVVKPEVDIVEVVQLVVTELSMWLESRGIKAGTMGSLTGENLASGVSKLLDEMDTTLLLEKQASLYKRSEAAFWEKVLKHMHPVWASQGLVSNKHTFTATAHVVTTFADQNPKVDRSALVTTAKLELEAGLKSRETLIRDLNPDWSEDRIQEEIKLIDGVEDESETAQ